MKARLPITIGLLAMTVSLNGSFSDEPWAGLSDETRGRLTELVQRIEIERDFESSISIRPEGELSLFCSPSDLVAIVGGPSKRLRGAAAILLRDPNRTFTLTDQHIEDLAALLHSEESASLAASVLATDAPRGIATLLERLDEDNDTRIRAATATALVRNYSVADDESKRRAKQTLLELMAKPYAECGPINVQTDQPWMVTWILDPLTDPSISDEARVRFLRALNTYQGDAFAAERRRVAVAALDHSDHRVRLEGARGILVFGPSEADLQLYHRIQFDPDHNVRRTLLWNLSYRKDRWVVPILMEGLDDEDLENRSMAATGLENLDVKEALPRLMDLVVQMTNDPRIWSKSSARMIPKAAVAVADIDGFDFRSISQCRTEGSLRIQVSVPRTHHFAAEAERLVEWWRANGEHIEEESTQIPP
jgi:hypothetical protein